MKSLLVAVSFLTRIPVSVEAATEREIGRSALWFPIVGMLVGGILLGSYLVFHLIFPALVAKVLVLVVLILISGAFHLDGLADTIDALYGGKDREDALRIMKDPHVGAMGVIAIVAVLLLKTAAAVSLSEPCFRGALLTMPIVAHGAMVAALALPYARPSGLGKAFADHRSHWDIVLAALLTFGAAFALLKFSGVGALLIALGAAGLLVSLAWRKVRGITGDVCGAVNEVAEAGFLLALTALAPVSFTACEGILPEAFWRWHL